MIKIIKELNKYKKFYTRHNDLLSNYIVKTVSAFSVEDTERLAKMKINRWLMANNLTLVSDLFIVRDAELFEPDTEIVFLHKLSKDKLVKVSMKVSFEWCNEAVSTESLLEYEVKDNDDWSIVSSDYIHTTVEMRGM